ncbi:hypothetical protein MTP99_019365 [Tenebrio molitor]|nr:hypothetical protein MTP99_019365 [Tenebrio molitor]
MVLPKGHKLCIAKGFRRVVFRIRKHFWLLSTGKWYFSTEKCGVGPRVYATNVRPRTPNSRDCGRKPVNKYPAVSSGISGFSIWGMSNS